MYLGRSEESQSILNDITYSKKIISTSKRLKTFNLIRKIILKVFEKHFFKMFLFFIHKKKNNFLVGMVKLNNIDIF